MKGIGGELIKYNSIRFFVEDIKGYVLDIGNWRVYVLFKEWVLVDCKYVGI